MNGNHRNNVMLSYVRLFCYEQLEVMDERFEQNGLVARTCPRSYSTGQCCPTYAVVEMRNLPPALADRAILPLAQNGLRIQTFYGTTYNAVRLQLWVSICVYVAMATARKQLGITANLTTFVQVLSLHALSKTPEAELFADINSSRMEIDIHNQLSFSNFNWNSIGLGPLPCSQPITLFVRPAYLALAPFCRI